jgi:hypothetical protein
MLHVMDIPFIENLAGYPHGSFQEDPDAGYGSPEKSQRTQDVAG